MEILSQLNQQLVKLLASALPVLDSAHVAPISDSVIGGMLTSKCAITLR